MFGARLLGEMPRKRTAQKVVFMCVTLGIKGTWGQIQEGRHTPHSYQDIHENQTIYNRIHIYVFGSMTKQVRY